MEACGMSFEMVKKWIEFQGGFSEPGPLTYSKLRVVSNLAIVQNESDIFSPSDLQTVADLVQLVDAPLDRAIKTFLRHLERELQGPMVVLALGTIRRVARHVARCAARRAGLVATRSGISVLSVSLPSLYRRIDQSSVFSSISLHLQSI